MFNTPRPSTGQLPLLDSGPTAAPDVIAATNDLRNPDPCGDDSSLSLEILLSQLLLSQVKTPVLVVCGEKDVIFPRPACDLQALHFGGSPDVTEKTIPGAGHAVTLGFTAADFRAAMASWLAQRGF